MTDRVHNLQRFRGLTGPLALSLSLSMLLLLPLLATACGETSEPEAAERVVEKEVVREVVVTPETPPGRELAQQVHDGDLYTLVEYDDRLAVFTGSGSPVTDPSLAGKVLRSYAWRQTVEGLDTGAMSDAVDVVQGVDSSLSGVREASYEMVEVFDELEALSANVPLLGRVSAMDVLAETYPGVGVAADSIRTLDDELSSIGRDTDLVSGTLERITTMDPSGVSWDEMESLFRDGAGASNEMEVQARSARSRMTDVLNVARDLEDALWQASGTPVIGDSIAEAAGTTGVFAASLSDISDLMQEYIDTLGSLGGRFEESIDAAERAQREYMSRWLQVPYDSTWRSVARLQPTASPTPVPAATTEPAALSTPTPIPTAAVPSGEIPFRIEWETSASTVEAGESFTLAVRMHDLQDSGEHGGISVSFPAVLEHGGSTGSYSSMSADVEVIEYTSGLSNVTFHQPGATIYHRENNRQFPAEYLLVESDDPSWSRSDDRTLVLRITPRRAGDFPIQIRGWLCADEYMGCVRRPADGPENDQQGWVVKHLSLGVSTAAAELTQNGVQPTPTRMPQPTSLPTETPVPTATPASPSSPVAGRIAFSSNRDGNNEIYVMDADGADQVRLTYNDGDDVLPGWSPDGQRIAFSSDRDGNIEIYVMDADGADQVRLTYNDATDSNPSWSPDSRHIAFNSSRGGNHEIYVMNADGAEQVRLTHNDANDSNPSWSPDGRHIAFNSDRDGNNEIYVMNADGADQVRLTHNDAIDSSPSWSPDGRRIVFESVERNQEGLWEGKDWEISTMNADGTDRIRLTDNDELDRTPSWSPDGRRIVFRSKQDGNNEIYVMNADGADRIRLTHGAESDDYPHWSPPSKGGVLPSASLLSFP